MTHPSHPSAATIAARRREFTRRVEGETLCTAFLRTVTERSAEVALRERADRGWREYTWSEYERRVALVAAGLARLGIAPGDRVALLCRNRPEFHFADLGALFLGAVPLSLYNSSPPEQIAYLLEHSGAVCLLVEHRDFLERVLRVVDQLPRLRNIIVIEPADTGHPAVLTFSELLDGPPADLATAVRRVRPGDAATIIYTSGTTGPPKGVVLSHHNICYAVAMHQEVSQVPLAGLRQISYLPMAHIGEREVTHYYHIIGGTEVTTCADLGELPALMIEVRPQWWFCAPRMWEKLRASIEAALLANPQRREEFQRALELGWRVHSLRNAGAKVSDEMAARWRGVRQGVIAPELARVGLADIVMAITGAAPIAAHTLRFFLSCGLKISDAYGASETSGIVSWSPHHIVLGTQGRPLPGLEMRLAADGEVLVRAPSVFSGYLDDIEQTGEALTESGWYHTGDIGTWDSNGNLSIIDRKKEILVPQSGHNVSPVMLESAVKRECPLIGQACAIGDERPYIAMIVVIDSDFAPEWAAERGLGELTLAELAEHPDIRAEIEAAVRRVNDGLAPAERIKAHVLIGELWLADSDVLTPTMKLKRRGVLERYSGDIDKLYAPA